MKIAFAGTPLFGRRILEALLAAAPEIVVVAAFSQPARPHGRHLTIEPTPVETLAREHGVPLHGPECWNDEALQRLGSHAPDVLVTAAYGLILPASALAVPKFGAVNVHTSLLPRWRGAAPVQRAIEAGDRVTGITIFQLDEGMDTGPILAKVEIDIGAEEDAATLEARLAEEAAALLPPTLRAYIAGKIVPIPQEHALAVRAKKMRKEEGNLAWSLPAEEIARKVRAFAPWPGVTIGGLKILKARPVNRADRPGLVGSVCAPSPLTISCGQGALELHTVQAPGKKPMEGTVYANGRRLKVGDLLT